MEMFSASAALNAEPAMSPKRFLLKFRYSSFAVSCTDIKQLKKSLGFLLKYIFISITEQYSVRDLRIYGT